MVSTCFEVWCKINLQIIPFSENYRYPILKAIYGQSHPEYSSYMYLLAPISLVILNPIGFIILELGRANNWDNASISSETGTPVNVPRRSKFYILLQVCSDHI